MKLGILSKNTKFPFKAKKKERFVCFIFIGCNLFDRFILCDNDDNVFLLFSFWVLMCDL